MVSPSKRSVPTRVSPLSSTDAWGKWRSRLMFSFSKSSFAVSMALASRLTISATCPRSAIGATMMTANNTAATMAAILKDFFMFGL